MAKSSPRGGAGVPDEPNGAARREKQADLDEAGSSEAADDSVVRVPGPGPNDARVGLATKRHIEDHDLASEADAQEE